MRKKPVGIGLMIAAIIVACFIWFIHTFSQEYTSYVQYRVRLNTNMEGYEKSALSNETLLVRGKSSGFYLITVKDTQDGFPEVVIDLDEKYLRKSATDENLFKVDVFEIRELIDNELSSIVIDYIETDSLSFNLNRQSFKKVPVLAASDITCRPQYMRTGGIVLRPDSVLVYGDAKDLEGVRNVMTKTIALYDLEKSVQGRVDLEPVEGFRVDEEDVYYSIDVNRYVENTETVPLSIINLPQGKHMMLLPSTVTVTYRTPLRTEIKGMEFVVDYEDYVKSAGSKVIPRMEKEISDIYSYTLEPKMVECISLSE